MDPREAFRSKGGGEENLNPDFRPLFLVFTPTNQVLLIDGKNRRAQGISAAELFPKTELKPFYTGKELSEKLLGRQDENSPPPRILIIKRTPGQLKERRSYFDLLEAVEKVGGKRLLASFNREMNKLVTEERRQINQQLISGDPRSTETIWQREN